MIDEPQDDKQKEAQEPAENVKKDVPPVEAKQEANPPEEKVGFEQIKQGNIPQKEKNIDFIMDVDMDVTIELGRTSMSVKDILSLGSGSVIELDKMAGEPVDIIVNNKLIAKGEVMVVDDNFGVRITEVISSPEDIGKMGI